ncbi:MAG TPA: S8 family serine peptidase [Opitutaceae bacterium]|nr:S8 family serine peptidase [Opitutaceae bacterium]
MNKPLLPLLAAVVGLACAVLFIRLWQDDHAAATAMRQVNAAPSSGSSPEASTTSAAALQISDPKVRAVMQQLAKLLLRHDVRPDETVLTFKDATALARFLQRAGQAGLTVVGRLDALNAVRVRYSDIGALQNELAKNAGDYSDVSGNYVFNIPQTPAKQDRAAINQIPVGNAALPMVGATGDRSTWGRGITIAILDTGVAADPTFGTGRLNTLDVGLGVAPGTAQDDGHGTSVASLASGASADAPGVAPAANILSIRVTDVNGTSDIFTISQAIVAAVDAGAKVINVSMGGYGTNPTLNGAITYALNNGAVVVAAAGNDQAAELAWPAADPRVVSVGAVDKAGQQVIFSNSGPQLQLTAPGYGVQTAWLDGQRVYVDGTSASAPIVSGAIAAVMSQNPTLTASEAAQVLDRTASDAGPPGPDSSYGNGILNVGWAMNLNNPAYVDTAVTSHYYDAANNQMDFVVQNRSGSTMAGMTLDVTAGTTTSDYIVSGLQPGQSQVIRVPVNTAQLNSAGQIRYTTTLVNPIGIRDQVPSNNQRSSVLTAPTTH